MTKLPDSIIVINLDRATDRWTRVQQSHAKHLGDRVALERLPAIDTNMVEGTRTPGTLSAPEKGFLLSHLRAFEMLAARGCAPSYSAKGRESRLETHEDGFVQRSLRPRSVLMTCQTANFARKR